MVTTNRAINGYTLTFLVDTGASAVVLNAAEARRLGIGPDRGRSVPVRGLGSAAMAAAGFLNRPTLRCYAALPWRSRQRS
ncbi:MAG: aspartyl protease family protein [Ectothiorhodospira sp.]